MGKRVNPGTDLRLSCTPPTLCGSSHLSDDVSYSDGCNGEWLVSFLILFCFFGGRQDEILAVSAPIQLKSILDFVFSSKLKMQGMY